MRLEVIFRDVNCFLVAYPKTTTINSPMTTEIPTTINAGTLIPREPIDADRGEAKLLDISKAL